MTESFHRLLVTTQLCRWFSGEWRCSLPVRPRTGCSLVIFRSPLPSAGVHGPDMVPTVMT